MWRAHSGSQLGLGQLLILVSSQGLSRESVRAFISMQITYPPYCTVSASLPLELFSRSRQGVIKLLYSPLECRAQGRNANGHTSLPSLLPQGVWQAWPSPHQTRNKSPAMRMRMSGTICINHMRSFQMAFILGVLMSSELWINPEWIPFSNNSTSELL